jgi:hypothetical protein
MKRWKDFNDKDLMKLLQEAIELQDGRYIKTIKEEITRRNRNE